MTPGEFQRAIREAGRAGDDRFLAEMAVEYAEVYLENGWWDSPNLVEHYPYILAVASYATDVYDTEGVNKVKALFARSHDGSI